MSTMAIVLWVVWAFSLLCAWVLRTRFYALFMGLMMGICVLVWTGLFGGLRTYWIPVVYAFQMLTFLHFLSLIRARLRPLWFRALVSIPGLWWLAVTLLLIPWAVVSILGFPPYGWWLPVVISSLGLFQSLRNSFDEVDIWIDGKDLEKLQRVDLKHSDDSRPLLICQISDPHMGPFMSEKRLHRICEQVVAKKPDMVLLTGDFMTMESQGDDGALG